MSVHWARIKQAVKDAAGLGLPKRPQIMVPAGHLGSAGEGWTVCAERIRPGSVVYSFGVGRDISFDLELIGRTGATVHAFDPTPGVGAWLGTQALPPGFIFHEFGLGAADGTALLYPHQNRENLNYSLVRRDSTADTARPVAIHTLATVMSMLGHGAIDLLKIDIEGSEYAVIDDMLREGIRPEQLLVEFHHGKIHDYSENDTVRTIRALNRAEYGIFHVSPSVREYSFMIKR